MKDLKSSLSNYERKQGIENELQVSFNESYKDEKFKRIVDKLQMSIEELAKYRTNIEEASIEYDNCINCKCLADCKNKIEGYAYLPEVKSKQIKFGYKPCKYKNKYKKETSYMNNVYTYDEPLAIRQAKMKDIYTKDENRYHVITYLTNFLENYLNGKKDKGLYLYGSFGAGKTYLISAMFNELAKNNIKSAIVFWPEYISHLKTLFGKDDYIETLNKIKKAPLLLIDDIGAETTTPWERDEVLCPILQYRMNEQLPTFFTSNLDKESLETHFSISKDGSEIIKSKRIIERINQLTTDMEMISKNLRK